MTEYPIDQSSLPRVEEVRRDFSVLEDGALAHCLQEQEIEQHYASNIQKNKLVQKDIRIAKKLQDEEDERNKIRSLEKQRQIEERDSEYARVIQEELRRKAEECQRREEEDKEIAKRLQELEQKEVERWSHDSPTRIQEDSKSPSHHRFPSEEEEEYYYCREANNKSPKVRNSKRSRRTPEHDCGFQLSKGRTAPIGCPSEGASGQDQPEERHSNSHRNVSQEARNNRSEEQIQIVPRGRTHSFEHSERTHIKYSSEQMGESRHGRSRSLREQGNEFSQHHPGRNRHSKTRSVESSEIDAFGRNHQSQRNRSRHLQANLSVASQSSPRKGNVLRSGDTSLEPNPADLLEWQIAELQLQSSDQLLQDEELARRLQEEEEKQLTSTRHQIQNEDFRAAQVAQDEEIAKYIQRQELESHQRSEEPDIQRESFDESSSRGSSSERKRRNTDQRNEESPTRQLWQNSEGNASQREHPIQEKSTLLARETGDAEKQPVPKNIAEELDPTFKSKRKESQSDMLTGCSQECSRPPQPHAVPVDGLYDFMDDGLDQAFVSPTKRHSDKWGRQKSRDKKENCKQQ
ncbi:trichohyalin-like isoform X1 [Pleurodeles waltl]|uniref:trichohyalin-like isoform X1 n=1 Tax=Pleurodeles waltl TaxID=8319 RepID=UPI00370975CE